MRIARIAMVMSAVILWAGSAFCGTAVQKSFQSASVGKSISYWLYRPANYDAEVLAGKKFSVIYLMHWWLYKAEGWHAQDQYRRNPKLDRMIDSVPGIICVAPQDPTTGPGGTGTSWWLDSPKDATWKYSSLIYQDLVRETEATNATYTDRSHRGLCGASMGGFGTLHNLRVHSDVFSVGYAIVPLTDLSKHIGNGKCEYGLCSPLSSYDAAFDPMANINDFKTRDIRLAFYTGHCQTNAPACAGTAFPNTCAELNCVAGSDFFEAEAVAFDAALTAAGVAHTFNNFAGDGHEYPTPGRMVTILKFFGDNFGLGAASTKLPYSRLTAKTNVNRVRLVQASSGTGHGPAEFVGIDGKRLRELPASGIVVEMKR